MLQTDESLKSLTKQFLVTLLAWSWAKLENKKVVLDVEVGLDSRREKSLLFLGVGSFRAVLTLWAMTISQLSNSGFVCHNNIASMSGKLASGM